MNSFDRLGEDPYIILEDLRRLRDQDGDYIMPRDQPKQSIILLGRSGMGKTTIVNVIKDSLYCPSRSFLSHRTEQPVSHNIGGLNIIDTPHIFDDRNQATMCKITGQGLLIDQFQVPFIDGILPLFGLVFSIQQVVNSDDITAMINFKNKFGQFRQKMVLILTHCEEKTRNQQLQLIDEFFEHSGLRRESMHSFFGRGVLFMGCLRRESFESGNRQALITEHRKVLAMRAEFIRRCQENESVIPICLSDLSKNCCCDLGTCNARCCVRWICCLCICTIVFIILIFNLLNSHSNDERSKPSVG